MPKKPKYKTGDLVMYHALIGGSVTSGPHAITYGPMKRSNGTWVVWLRDKVGCVACDAISPVEDVRGEQLNANWTMGLNSISYPERST